MKYTAFFAAAALAMGVAACDTNEPQPEPTATEAGGARQPNGDVDNV